MDNSERNQEEYDKGYKRGESDAFGRMKYQLLNVAADYFKQDKDEYAQLIRNLIKKLEIK